MRESLQQLERELSQKESELKKIERERSDAKRSLFMKSNWFYEWNKKNVEHNVKDMEVKSLRRRIDQLKRNQK